MDPEHSSAGGVPCTRVLFVDASREQVADATRILDCGADLATANSAEQALALAAREGPFALILADYAMPGANGVELLCRMRERHPECVRMLLTGLVEPEVVAAGLREGAIYRFVPKPFTPDQLRTAVEEGLEQHERERRERVRLEQQRFTTQVLAGFTQRLDERLTTQLRAVRRLAEFALALGSATRLEQVAERAAGAASALLGGAPVRLELGGQGERAQVCVQVGRGFQCSGESLPVPTSEGPVGSFALDLGARGPLSPVELELLEVLAASTGTAALGRMASRQRDAAHHATIVALAEMAERRDNETGLHLERVSAYCSLTAAGLREDGRHVDVIDERFVAEILDAAPLHDIGKVGIPDSILHKPGKLDAGEWEIMKRHTEIGADILRNTAGRSQLESGILAMGLDIAWCHHERWDGTGYPRRLAGEAIPLAARILALADVYDALSTRRPYKMAWPHARSLEYLREGTGSHFDPDVAAAFLRRADQADEIRVRLADEAA